MAKESVARMIKGIVMFNGDSCAWSNLWWSLGVPKKVRITIRNM